MNLTLRLCPRCQKIPHIDKYFNSTKLFQLVHKCEGFSGERLDVIGKPKACEKSWNVFANYVEKDDKLLKKRGKK